MHPHMRARTTRMLVLKKTAQTVMERGEKMKTTAQLLMAGTAVAMLPAQAWAADAVADVATAQSQEAPDTPGQAPADGAGIAEIVVTASRTGAAALQKVPIAITAFSADRLDGSQVLNVKDLVQLTPSLNVAQVTASAVIYMRGIGSSNVFGGSDPSVTTQLDGVYIARAFGQFQDFADIERLEVLRGPQGTLYGRNAIGGTINIISRKPSNEFTGKAQVAYGNYDALTMQGYASGPIVQDKVQASISGNYVRRDDYFKNVNPALPGTGNADRGGVRGQLRIVPTEKLELITRADWNKSNERFDSYDHLLVRYAPGGTNPTPLANSIVGDYHKVAIELPQRNRTKIWGVSQEANLDLTDTLTLKSLTAYRWGSYALSVDNDGTEQRYTDVNQAETSRQFSQEFNLVLNTDRFDAVAGLFYFRDRTSTRIQTSVFASPSTPAAAAFTFLDLPESKTRSVAAFVQGTFKITPELNLTAGLRYTKDRKSIAANFVRRSILTGAVAPGFPFVTDFSRTDDAWTPKFGLDWQVTPQVMLYGSVTRGFKSGGTSIFANTLPDLSFGPETIWSYEGGMKSDLLDRRLRVNLSVFRYDYKGLQVQSLIGPGVVAIRNASNARITGGELEVTARPVDPLTLGFNYALLNAKYEDFPNATISNPLAPFVTGDPRFNPATRLYNASGNRLNAAPKGQLSAWAQVNFDLAAGKAFLRGEYYHQTRAHYDPSNAPIMSQKPYGLVNASVGWNSDDRKWGVQLIAKNLVDKQYLVTIAANGLVPAGLAGAPRTMALQVTRSW